MIKGKIRIKGKSINVRIKNQDKRRIMKGMGIKIEIRGLDLII